MDRVYNWKSYVDNGFEDFSGEESALKLLEISDAKTLDSKLYPLCKFFLSNYSWLKIPIDIESKLDELLLKFGLVEQKDLFLVIGCALQDSYSENIELEVDDLLKDFDSEFKDFKDLLKVLKMYLFTDNKKLLPEIVFKTVKDGNFSIKNYFVKSDIYEALCNSFGLNKENYEERSEKLLNMTNMVIVDKYPEKVKVDFIKAIYNYLIESEFKRADALRFIGVFFKFFQVEINNNETEFLVYHSLAENLKSINIKNLYFYITRERKLFHN